MRFNPYDDLVYSINLDTKKRIHEYLDATRRIVEKQTTMHKDIMMAVEKEVLLLAMYRGGWSQVQACKILGMNRNTLRYRLKLHGIKPESVIPKAKMVPTDVVSESFILKMMIEK